MHGMPDAPSPPPPSIPDGPAARAVPTWTRAALPLGLTAALLIALVVAGWQPLLQLDRQIADALHQHALVRPDWTAANRILTDWVWDPWTMRLLLALAVVWLWRGGERLLAYWTGAAAAVCTALQQLLKAVIGRDRPVWERPVDSADFAAMPSGHAMTAAFTCAALLWLTHRADPGRHVLCAVLVVGTASVAGVCATRVALGVHWMTDTLAGALLGTAVAAAAAAGWDRSRLSAAPGTGPAPEAGAVRA